MPYFVILPWQEITKNTAARCFYYSWGSDRKCEILLSSDYCNQSIYVPFFL